MPEFDGLDNEYFRTKETICLHYLDDLIKNGAVSEHQKEYYSKEGISEVFELLLEKLYETEMRRGQRVSTLDAFYHFCNYVLYKDVSSGRPIWNPFVRQLFLDVEMHRLTAIMAHRGSGKSFFFYCLYVPFKTFLWRGFDVLLISNIRDMCERNMRKLKQVIINNELLLEKRDVEQKGSKNLKWTEMEIEYNAAIIKSCSIGTSPRSAHVPLIIFDDPLRDDNRYSDQYIENYTFGQLMPCAERTRGRLIISGTPFHFKDLFHTAMRRGDRLCRNGEISTKGFYCKKYPAIVDKEKNTVLIPEVFSYENLMKTKETQGERFFNREYMLICIDDSTALFPYTMVAACSDDDEKYIYEGHPDKTYVIGADVATSGAASADFSAFIVLEVTEGPSKEHDDDDYIVAKKVVRHVFHEKGVEVSEQIDIIEELSKNFNDAYVLVEKNNVGVALIQELEKRNVNVESIVTDKFKKEGAVRFLINEMKRRRLIFPEEEEEIKRLKDELRNFGVKLKGNKERMESLSGHDDLLTALWTANLATQQMGGGCSYAVTQD
jgi:hypothetical protein